jgi:hypothetical protein
MYTHAVQSQPTYALSEVSGVQLSVQVPHVDTEEYFLGHMYECYMWVAKTKAEEGQQVSAAADPSKDESDINKTETASSSAEQYQCSGSFANNRKDVFISTLLLDGVLVPLVGRKQK